MPRDLELTSVEDANGVLLLQTDLSMNHSFSSVPLCDLDGPILVICSKKNEGGVQCIYFAITTNYGTWAPEELRKHGEVRKRLLGLALTSLNSEVVYDVWADPNYKMTEWLEKEVKHTNVTPFSRGLILQM